MLGNHPTLGMVVTGVALVVLFCLELRILVVGRRGSLNRVLSVIAVFSVILSGLLIIAHFVARIIA
jgi:hypothetical protein